MLRKIPRYTCLSFPSIMALSLFSHPLITTQHYPISIYRLKKKIPRSLSLKTKKLKKKRKPFSFLLEPHAPLTNLSAKKEGHRECKKKISSFPEIHSSPSTTHYHPNTISLFIFNTRRETTATKHHFPTSPSPLTTFRRCNRKPPPQ